MIKCQGQKVKYKQKDLNTRDIHVKYQSSSTHYSKDISKIKVLKSWSKVKGQGHKVKIVGSQDKALSHKIFMWNIKALALIVRKLLVGLQDQGYRIKKKCWYPRKGIATRNIHVKCINTSTHSSNVLRRAKSFPKSRSSSKVKVIRSKIVGTHICWSYIV